MLLPLAITVFVATLLLALFIAGAPKLGLVAVPNERSAHSSATPCGAGIAFISAAIVGFFASQFAMYAPYLPSILGILIVFLLGVYDDLKHSSSNVKFLITAIAAGLILFNGYSIGTIGTYFGKPINIGWFAYPVTIIALVGFTNALNLVDGLDGLAGSISLVILSGLLYIAYLNNDALIMRFGLVLFFAVMTFLVFNWNPAKVFMGDSGSLTLGFIIGFFSIKALEYIDPVSILYIAAIPIFDTVTVMIRRKLNGQSIVNADKNHLHHILLEFNHGNVKATVLMLAAAQGCFTLFGVFVTTRLGQEITLPLFILLILLLLLYLEKIHDIESKQ